VNSSRLRAVASEIEPREQQVDSASYLHSPLQARFAQHGAFVYRSLCYLGVREQDLDDALQQVFLGAWHDRRDAPSERGWLYAMCKRVARDRTLMKPQFWSDPAQIKDREGLAFAQQLLDLLPEEQREVFLLYEVEGMPMPEIARSLQCPVRIARSLLHEARERIVAEVERRAAEASDD
jgi:RNA polymerase sigma-70 factor (ECF subfamily)